MVYAIYNNTQKNMFDMINKLNNNNIPKKSCNFLFILIDDLKKNVDIYLNNYILTWEKIKIINYNH